MDTAYFVRFEPSKQDAQENVRLASKGNNGMPVAFEAAYWFEAAQYEEGLRAAIDAYIIEGERSTWFTVYAGRRIGKQSADGAIFFAPESVVRCDSWEDIQRCRDGGATQQKADSERLEREEENRVPKRAVKARYAPRPAPVVPERITHDVQIRVSEPIPVYVVSSTQGQSASVPVPQPVLQQYFGGEHAATAAPLKKRRHPVRRALILAAVFGLSLFAMHVYDSLGTWMNWAYGGNAAPVQHWKPIPQNDFPPSSRAPVSMPQSYQVISKKNPVYESAPNPSATVDLSIRVDSQTTITVRYAPVVGCSGYEQEEFINSVLTQPARVYFTNPALGYKVNGVRNYGLGADTWYAFKARPFWRTTNGILYGQWSALVQARTYPTAQEIFHASAPAIVQIYTRNDAATGSGFWIPGGYIVTNWHAASGNGLFSLAYRNHIYGNKHWARVVAHSYPDDLALLKPLFASASGAVLSGGYLAWQPAIKPGIPVYVIGHPLGNAIIQSAGHITAVNQTIRVQSYGVLYPMDRGIYNAYPGNSGSPIVNAYGNVIGVDEDGPEWTASSPLAQVSKGVDGFVPLSTLSGFLQGAFANYPKELNRLKLYGYLA